jgi:EAL domain-containing protein (putative c-di-GMP-specific phosphodiesterase class I)
MSKVTRRVLVLDDDLRILSLLAARLSKLPIHLVQCTEIEAAETLMDHMGFGVLVCDLEVSKLGGLEGIRLIRHAVTHFAQTEVIIFSGNVTPLAYQMATALGVTEVCRKPGDLGKLVQLVGEFTTVLSSDGDNELQHQLTAIEPLEQVVEGQSISTVFQPIIELSNGGSPDRLFGIEALSRGPGTSFLKNPMILFDYAVRKELVFQTDTLCINSALCAGREMSTDARLFINTHPRALSHPDYPSTLQSLLEAHRVPRNRVVLEVTEQSAILDPKGLAAILEQVRDQGVRVALDDFGEGSSNLHLIHDLRPEFLKISGLFCDGIDKAPAKQAMVRAAVGVSQELGMKTIMERVESDRELDTVRALGIDYVQGYHFGRPQTHEDLAVSWPEEFGASRSTSC